MLSTMNPLGALSRGQRWVCRTHYPCCIHTRICRAGTSAARYAALSSSHAGDAAGVLAMTAMTVQYDRAWNDHAA